LIAATGCRPVRISTAHPRHEKRRAVQLGVRQKTTQWPRRPQQNIRPRFSACCPAPTVAEFGEVEDSIGRLPSIAIFVDGDGLIDGVVDDIRPLLATRNIPVAGCKEGKVVGDEREVRVFDVQHIKGLEFEAVFFVSVDRLAEGIPDLFPRFVYVGVTRAATYLGVTCEGALPPRLELLRPHFGTESWHLE
jgi:UvrD-like helicase C-terminal domain